MSYQWNAFLIALYMQLRSWKTWLLVLLLPLTAWGMTVALPAEDVVSPVKVGVALPEEGGEEFWEALQSRSGTITTFIEADKDTIIGKVTTGQWDCGIVLPDDFAQRAENMDTTALIDIYTSEGSTMYPLIRETAAACLINVIGEGIARDYLVNNGIDASTLEVKELEASDRVQVNMTTLDGKQLDAIELSGNTTGRVIRGVLAIVLMIWILLTAVDLGRWLEQPGVSRFAPLRSTTERLLPRIVASMLPVLISSAVSVFIYSGKLTEFLPLAVYLLTMCAWLLVIARVYKIWSAMPVLMPFVPVLCLVFSPIILDFSAMIPGLNYINRWMPVTLYLYAAEGDLLNLLVLLLMAAAGVMLSVMLDHRHKANRKAAN